MNRHINREAWLQAAMTELDKAFFAENGYKLPERLEVSVGFARGSKKAIGICFDPVHSVEQATQMWVCPTQDEPTRVLDILLHEMIHASVGCEEGHKGLFRKLAKEFGLEGKMTATYVTEGTELHKRLASIATTLGPYPHKKMVLKPKEKGKGGSGWIRLVSPNDETYKVVISPKVLEEHGAPTDPWGDLMEQVE